MDNRDFDKYLTDRYHGQITWYDRRANQNKKRFFASKIYVIVVAVLVPVMVSAKVSPTWIPIVLSASIAIIEGLVSLFKFHELWIDYRTTCEMLRKEEYFYRAGLNDYSTATDKEALFVDRVESLVSRENTMWLARAKKESTNNRQQG